VELARPPWNVNVSVLVTSRNCLGHEYAVLRPFWTELYANATAPGRVDTRFASDELSVVVQEQIANLEPKA